MPSLSSTRIFFRNLAGDYGDPEANGKAVSPPDNDTIQPVSEHDDPPDGLTNYGMTDDRGFTSSQFNKV